MTILQVLSSYSVQASSFATFQVSDYIFNQFSHRRRKVPKSVWAMASAAARAYNGGLGTEPPAGVQGAEPPVRGQGGEAPLKLKPF